MKKIYKSFVAITCLILAFVSIALVGCNNTKVEKITLNKTSLSLVVGNSETLTATITPDEAKDETITWSTDNDKVATVANGKVTAVAEGKATITAKAGDQTATCTVTVKEKEEAPATVAVTSVTIDPTTLTLTVGGATGTLTATVAPSNATDKTVTWTSSNNAIATVSNTGVVTAVAAGSATITAKAGDKTATCAVTVNAATSGSGSSTEFLYGATFALNTPDQKVKLGNVEFANPTSNNKAALTLGTTKYSAVFALTGAAATFSADQATAFGGVRETRDNFVVLTFNNPNKSKIEMAWVEKDANDDFVTTTLTGKPGYKTINANSTDTDMILWLNRPNRTDYFCIKVGNDVSILDVSGATINKFFDANGSLTLSSQQFPQGTNIKIEKQLGANNTENVDVYTVTGKAANFTATNKGVFTSDGKVDEKHSYINLQLRALAGEQYRSGWVSTPTEALTGNYANVPTVTSGSTTSADNNWILWVTNPNNVSKNYFKIDIKNGRQYVLDISNLDTNNNILSIVDGCYGKDSKPSTDEKGYQNAHNDLNISTLGNISKITGTATKFTNDNGGKEWDSDQNHQRPEADKDEYIVVKVDTGSTTNNQQSDKKWKYGWVKTPDTKLCDGKTAGTNAEWGCTDGCEGVREWPYNDNLLILWVTRQATSGYYLRIEVGYGESNNDGARRAYVYDLSELLSANGNGERVQDFFKVVDGQVSSESQQYENGTESGLKIERYEGRRDAWKITGNATKFNNNNGAQFGVTSSLETSGYVIFSMNVKKNSSDNNNADKIEIGFVSKVGDAFPSTDTNSVTTFDWNERMILMTTGKQNKVLCIKVTDDGVTNTYYLDFSGITGLCNDTSKGK